MGLATRSKGGTHIDDVLNLPQYSGDGLADERDCAEQSSLADQDVQKSLVDADELQGLLAGDVHTVYRATCHAPRGKRRR